MARIAKQGLEYFPFDIDFFQDIRIRKLIKRQGGKAVTVYALLLCLIYKNGYYMQWDNELPFIGSEISGFDEAYISEVIKTCLTLGLFDRKLYDSEQVLTSRGIQTRYCNIQRLNKRMSRIDRYCLIDQQPCCTAGKEKAAPRQSNASMPDKLQPLPNPARPETSPSSASDDNAQWLALFFADANSENLRMLCRNFGLDTDDSSRLRSLADAVVAEWELSHTSHRDYSDWSRHLISAMRIKNRESSPKTDRQNRPTPAATSDYSFKGGFGGQDV